MRSGPSEELSHRFTTDIHPATVIELADRGLIPVAGYYKGYDLYNGQALEAFADRDTPIEAAAKGRLRTADECAAPTYAAVAATWTT